MIITTGSGAESDDGKLLLLHWLVILIISTLKICQLKVTPTSAPPMREILRKFLLRNPLLVRSRSLKQDLSAAILKI